MQMFTRNTIRFPAILLTAIALSLTAGACNNNDGEVLAAYQGGDIQRGDFRFFFSLNRAPERHSGKHVHDSPPGGHAGTPNQERLLIEYARLRLAAEEARKRGLEKSENFKKLLGGIEERSVIEGLIRFLDREHQGDDRYYYIMDVQHLYIKSRPAGHAALMKKHLDFLNSKDANDPAIDAYIREHHELKAYRAAGGRQVPVCESCGFKLYSFMTGALEHEPLNRFTLVRNIAGGDWLIRKTGGRLLRGGGLKDFYADYLTKQAKTAGEYLKGVTDAETKARVRKVIPLEAATIKKKAEELAGYVSDETARKVGLNNFRAVSLELARSAKFKLYPIARIPAPDPKNPRSYFAKIKRDFKPDTPLFSMNGKDYTYAELNAAAPAGAFTKRQQLEVLSLVYLHRLWKSRPEYKRMRASALFRRVRAHRLNEMLALQLYKDSLKGMHVDWSQIKRRYSGSSAKGHSVHSHDGSLRSAYAKLDKLRAELVQKYKLKIHRDRLKANVI